MRLLHALVLALTLASLSTPWAVSSRAAEAATEKATVKNISIDEAEKHVAQSTNVMVLDVRTPKEFKAGHLAGARAINFYDADFKDQVAGLDKTKTYIVFCAVGGRSAKACSIMAELGFQDVRNVEGGMKAWEKAGKKTVQ